jgi:hypothetical protein
LIEVASTVKSSLGVNEAGAPHLYIDLPPEDSYNTQGQLLWIDRTTTLCSLCSISIVLIIQIVCPVNIFWEYATKVLRHPAIEKTEVQGKSKTTAYDPQPLLVRSSYVYMIGGTFSPKLPIEKHVVALDEMQQGKRLI